jgi:CAAX protease family protein
MPDSEEQEDEFQYSHQSLTIEQNSIHFPAFKKAFWLIFALIFTMQIIQGYYALKIGFSDQIPSSFYLNIEIISITWYILSVIIIHQSFVNQGLNPWFFYGIDFSVIKRHLAQVLKYFAGTALVVILLSLLSAETELQLEDQPVSIIIIMLFTVTIVAPVCEEIVFRGYLYSSMIPVFKRDKERLVVNAMLFAAAHVFIILFAIGGSIPYYIFVLGYLIAKLYRDSKSILPCILLHLLNNTLVAVIDLIKLDIYNTSKLIQALI